MSSNVHKPLTMGLLAATVALVVALLAGPASAVNPPPGGDTISCSNSGTTFGGVNQVYTSACLSFETAFYVSVPNAPTNCSFGGYIGRVYTTDYTVRFEGNWCADGVWHFSDPWGSNEARFSWMQIDPSGADWMMIQYLR